MKKTTKTTSSKKQTRTSWEKVWVMCGDEYLCKLSMLSLLEDKSVVKTFYSNDDVESIVPYLTNYSFLNNETGIILKEPSVATLKAILPLVENNKIAVPVLIVYLAMSDPESGDFVKEAKKQKRVFPHQYVVSSDTAKLRQFVASVWTGKNNTTITPQACAWIVEHAPTKTAKTTLKKEEEVFDLVFLNNELCKIASFKNNLELTDVQNYCTFTPIVSIWDCVNTMLYMDVSQSYEQYQRYLNDNSIKLLISILKGQIEFIIEVQSLYQKGMRDPVAIQKALSYSTFVEQYPGIECKENSGGTPSFWRIKKILEKIHTYDTATLAQQLNALRAANIDLQSGADQLLVSDYLFFALKGKAKYNDPFFG